MKTTDPAPLNSCKSCINSKYVNETEAIGSSTEWGLLVTKETTDLQFIELMAQVVLPIGFSH